MSKRVFDVLLVLLALPVVLPLLLVLALWIKLDSPGPALFLQERVGRGGRLFRIHKLRTMRVHDGSGPLITQAGDARITRAGRWLRRTKLDELPQWWDVLRGAMSLVGPRPEVPRYMALYPPEVRARILSVRPGITSSAAMVFRDEERLLAAAADPERVYIEQVLPAKQRHDLQYVDHHSLGGDVRILLGTLKVVWG
ncbi:sugar transferase [Ottowia sp.]|uniref:sugar transferase n=1 Tax=Ottowia sp. TaxID=1898956 RepID=UPI003A867683